MISDCYEPPHQTANLVFLRHRFQRPDKCHFWSRQSEFLLTQTLLSSRNLTRLSLCAANDSLLRAVAVACVGLHEIELQFAYDVTEEGLFALAGKSAAFRDQGAAA
jgi:hypothetical protein